MRKESGSPEDSTLHIHPTQELGENGLPVGQITNIAEGGRQISFLEERSILASSGWHTDVSFEPRPASYTLLQMVRFRSILCRLVERSLMFFASSAHSSSRRR